MARRSKVDGVTKLRRKLRRIDPEITAELRDELAVGLNMIAQSAWAMAPVDTGEMRDSIQVQISRDGLSGVVGPAAKAAEIVRRRTGSAFGRTVRRGKAAGKALKLRAGNKKLLMQFYKAYWIEFGTKGNAKLNIPMQPARPFMGPAFTLNRSRIAARVQASIKGILEKVSRG